MEETCACRAIATAPRADIERHRHRKSNAGHRRWSGPHHLSVGRRHQYHSLCKYFDQCQGISEANIQLRRGQLACDPQPTLNLGVRWEIYFPESVNGPGRRRPCVLPRSDHGKYLCRRCRPLRHGDGCQETSTSGLAIGFAYQPNPRTVIRGGYGRSFDIGVFGSIFGHVVTQNLPVLANQNLTSSGPNTAAFNLAVGPAPFVFPASLQRPHPDSQWRQCQDP